MRVSHKRICQLKQPFTDSEHRPELKRSRLEEGVWLMSERVIPDAYPDNKSGLIIHERFLKIYSGLTNPHTFPYRVMRMHISCLSKHLHPVVIMVLKGIEVI